MSSRRLLKAAEAIREVVSMAILTELKDPRVKNVTVTYVEVAPDMRSAKVHVSVMGTDTQQALTLRGLQNAAGFLQHRISDRIDTRYTPRLQFIVDEGVKKSIAVSEILREVLPASASPDDATASASANFAGVDDDERDDERDDAVEEELDDEVDDEIDDEIDELDDEESADDQASELDSSEEPDETDRGT